MEPSIYNSLSEDIAAASESLMAMMQKEKTIYMTCGYLHPPLPDNDNSLITESDRIKIVDWCYGVTDHCDLDRETVAIAMEMVDRFLSKPSRISYTVLRDRTEFQLLAMSALGIAIKTTQRKFVVGYDFLSGMSQGVYSVEDIEVMEMNLLEGLSWRVCAPTSIQMAHYIISLILPHVDLPESTLSVVLDEVRYQTEHAVRDYNLSMKRPSTVAVAAIFNSLEQIDQQDRRAILSALPSVLDENFDSPRDMLSARNKLLSLVEGHDDTDDETIMTESPSEVEECILDSEAGECFWKKKTHLLRLQGCHQEHCMFTKSSSVTDTAEILNVYSSAGLYPSSGTIISSSRYGM